MTAVFIVTHISHYTKHLHLHYLTLVKHFCQIDVKVPIFTERELSVQKVSNLPNTGPYLLAVKLECKLLSA